MGYNAFVRVEKTDEYATWIDSLKDPVGRARILVRVECLIAGNPAFIVPSAKGFRNSRSTLVPDTASTTRSEELD